MVEQRPFKPKVVGSIPTAPTNISFVNNDFWIVEGPLTGGAMAPQFDEFDWRRDPSTLDERRWASAPQAVSQF